MPRRLLLPPAASLLITHRRVHLKEEKCIGKCFNLSEAFDAVSVTILLKKLEHKGIRGTTLNWFTSKYVGKVLPDAVRRSKYDNT